MIEENGYKFILRTSALLILMIGGAIAIQITLMWLRADKNHIRAKIFLNEGFLRKSWFYMFAGTTFFAIEQLLVLFFGYYSYISILAESFKIIFLALVVIILLDYYKLIKTPVRE